MTPRQREDDNNLSVGNRNHLKLGLSPNPGCSHTNWDSNSYNAQHVESDYFVVGTQNSTSTSTRDREGRTLLAIKNLRHVPQWEGCVAFLLL